VRIIDKKHLLALWARYERPASGAALIGGFVIDLLIAKRPDSLWDNLFLLALLVVAAGCIVILSRRSLRPKKAEGAEIPEAEPLALLFILQFCFGALASNLLVLYGYSGTLSGTALFLGILAAMLIGNEFLRSRYSQLRYNLAVYYTLSFTYLMIAVPTFMLHSVGAFAFLLTGVISLALMALFLFILSGSARLFRGKLGRHRIIESSAIVFGIFSAFTVLYFTHLIPPVPLSLKAIGTYHSITRSTEGYAGAYEPAPWWQFWSETSRTYHAQAGKAAYCFSSIFAPGGITAPIVHHWEWYDPATEGWATMARVTFPITGGRTGGYYGYSIKSLTALGSWRCNVETERGALIGRTHFTAVPGEAELTEHKL
jgi:hypothetical protein